MEVFALVSHIKEVEKGTPIGYGHSYVAESDRKIATVGIGYADGYNRCLTGKGWVLIGGKKAFITGKVCMDQIMVDVTDIPDVKVGDKVVIMGRMEDEEISAETLASLCDTISYEIISTFMPRVKRFYFKDGKLIKKIPQGDDLFVVFFYQKSFTVSSINFSSSSVKCVLFIIPMFSFICSGFEAPMSTLVATPSFITQERAICERGCPLPFARLSRALSFSIFSGEMV